MSDVQPEPARPAGPAPRAARGPDPTGDRLRAAIEALAFAADQPLTLEELAEIFPGTPRDALGAAIEEVARDCEAGHRGLRLMAIAGGWRLATKSELGGHVRALFRARHRRRLSAQALETLAIIAYRQPITTPEIQAIRGADPGGVLETLLEKHLIRILGRRKVVGKPLLYGTTPEFLAHFGLNSLQDLPSPEEFGGLVARLDQVQAAAAGDGARAAAIPPRDRRSGAFEEDDEDGHEDVESEDDDSEAEDDGDDS
jgi:segregation and condensation protein B